MAIHGKEARKVRRALAYGEEYKGGSALTITKSFHGWGRFPEPYPVSNPHDNPDVRVWVYSYGTPIGWLLWNGNAIVPDHGYSVTTTHHQGLARTYLGRPEHVW